MGSFLARGTSPHWTAGVLQAPATQWGRPRSVTSTGAPFHLSTNQVPNSADHLPIRSAGLSADCFKNALCLGLDRRCCWQLLPRDREPVILPNDRPPTRWPHAGTFRRPYAPRCEDGYFVQRAADYQVGRQHRLPVDPRPRWTTCKMCHGGTWWTAATRLGESSSPTVRETSVVKKRLRLIRSVRLPPAWVPRRGRNTRRAGASTDRCRSPLDPKGIAPRR